MPYSGGTISKLIGESYYHNSQRGAKYMTRKHYIRIAETLAQTLVEACDSQFSYGTVRTLCRPWINYLSADNPLFNEKTFTNYVWDQYSMAMGYEIA